MTNVQENLGAQRTRRNIMKMGVVLASSAVAASSAHAVPSVVCSTPAAGHFSSCSNCFLKGTKIQTAEGERKVEDLAIGDFLPTMFGGLRPVQWIGRYPIKKSDPSRPWVKDAMPMRIARSALGPGIPNADLYVTGSHAVFIDGVLVPAEALINGATITRFEPSDTDELEYFHIKFETHDVIYAERAPVETLRHVDESAVNFAEYFRLYGEPRAEDALCAPLVPVGGRAELTSRLRSAISPWIDRRDLVDVVRDRWEERDALLAR
jgi:hypothetical protein